MSNQALTRSQVATLLVHALTGDSWGIQEAMIEADLPLTTWASVWELGKILRDHLPEDVQCELAIRVRRDIARSVADEGSAT